MIGGSCNGDSSVVIRNDRIKRSNEKHMAQSIVDHSMVHKHTKCLPKQIYKTSKGKAQMPTFPANL